MGANGVIKTVPNQRIITVKKEPTDKQHLYAKINLSALGEAAANLSSVGGFKLYVYLAKNQPNYTFAFSSSHFFEWSGLGKQAYTTAFNELVEKGYLVQNEKIKDQYLFYEKSQQKEDSQQKIPFSF